MAVVTENVSDRGVASDAIDAVPARVFACAKNILRDPLLSERKWQQGLERSPHDYRLFKAKAAAWLERYH